MFNPNKTYQKKTDRKTNKIDARDYKTRIEKKPTENSYKTRRQTNKQTQRHCKTRTDRQTNLIQYITNKWKNFMQSSFKVHSFFNLSNLCPIQTERMEFIQFLFNQSSWSGIQIKTGIQLLPTSLPGVYMMYTYYSWNIIPGISNK